MFNSYWKSWSLIPIETCSCLWNRTINRNDYSKHHYPASSIDPHRCWMMLPLSSSSPAVPLVGQQRHPCAGAITPFNEQLSGWISVIENSSRQKRDLRIANRDNKVSHPFDAILNGFPRDGQWWSKLYTSLSKGMFYNQHKKCLSVIVPGKWFSSCCGCDSPVTNNSSGLQSTPSSKATQHQPGKHCQHHGPQSSTAQTRDHDDVVALPTPRPHQ